MNVHQKCPILLLQLCHLNDHIPEALTHLDWGIERRVHTCFHVILDMIHILARIRKEVGPVENLQGETCQTLAEIIGATLSIRSRLATTALYTNKDIDHIRIQHAIICSSLDRLEMQDNAEKETSIDSGYASMTATEANTQ